MTRIISIILTTLLLSSCWTGLTIRKSKIKYLDTSFSATVANQSYKVIGRRYGDMTLLNLFEIRDENIDSLHIYFNNKRELKFTYTDQGKLKEKTFKGNFSKEGYFEIYLRNESKEIPPVIPILYARYNINRIRMALSIEEGLIIDNMWIESGHILILGAGDSGRRQSFFKFKSVQ